MTPQDRVWDEIKHEIFCSRSEFDDVTRDFEFIPMRGDGVVMRAGTELHIFGKLALQDAKRILRETIQQYGKATCLCPKNEAKGQRILRMFGFKRIDENDRDYFYEVTL